MPLTTFTDPGGATIQYMVVDGIPYPYVEGVDQENAIKALKGRKSRPDDVLLVNYPKSGTHWLWEIMSMMHRGSTETIQTIKQDLFLEALPEGELDQIASPRILNTHCHYRLLPTDMQEKWTKIVLIHRNPKDVAVSHYNHCRNLEFYRYDGSWENFLQLFIDGHVDYGSWFDYQLDWEQEISAHPDHPIHVIMYEDLKQNCQEEIAKLAVFLELSISRELCSDIAEKCSFSHMVKDKQSVKSVNPHLNFNWKEGSRGFYRKGRINVTSSNQSTGRVRVIALVKKAKHESTERSAYTKQ